MKIKLLLSVTILLIMAFVLPMQAQVEYGTYDVQFSEPVIDCDSGKLCTNIQIRSANDGETFSIGSHTFFFAFNGYALKEPVYKTLAFNDLDSCVFSGFDVAYNKPTFGIAPDNPPLEANVTTIMKSPDYGCPEVGTDWVDVGEVCFIISDGFQDTGLKFVPNLTTVSINADDGNTHTQGTLFETDIPIDCMIGEIDSDNDGLTDEEEEALCSDPNNEDTDGDGLTDGMEVNVLGSDPCNEDTDGDGLLDKQETELGSFIKKADTDEDGLLDGEEVNTYGTNPVHSDSDLDGLTDGEEVNTYNTEPLKDDTDGDGLRDGQEVNDFGTDPTKADSDEDGLTDSEEVNSEPETDPNNNDTDGDGLTDGDEVNQTNTDPTKADTDGDELEDGDEITKGTNPNKADSDEDGLTDGAELNTYNTEPLKDDTDGDGLLDGEEVNVYGSNPNDEDSDGDTINDGDEVSINTDPNDVDSDNDNVQDGEEVDDVNNPRDTDDDGIINALDNDDDDDGIPTIDEDTNGNGDYTDDDFDMDGNPDYLDKDPVGIKNVIATSGYEMELFPNPVKNVLSVDIHKPANVLENTIQIFDTQGQVVKTLIHKENGKTLEIYLGDIPAGMYLLSVFDGSLLVQQSRFVKH